MGVTSSSLRAASGSSSSHSILYQKAACKSTVRSLGVDPGSAWLLSTSSLYSPANPACPNQQSALGGWWDVSSSCSTCLVDVLALHGSSSLLEHSQKSLAFAVAADANTSFMSCFPPSVFLTTVLFRPNVSGPTLII